MSHMIENNMIAYKGEKPWHGLGIEVPAEATGEEMLRVAKMDWKVQRRALAMRAADGSGLITDPLKGYKAIVRADNDSVFQIATDRYNIVQNAEVIDVFRNYCEAGHAKMETVGGLKGGAIMWALAKLNGGTGKTLDGGDELKGYLLMATSHDGSVRTVGKATQVRVVCWNTLSAALKGGATFQMKHSKKWTPETAADAKNKMGMAVQQIQNVNNLAEKLSHVSVDEKGRLEFLTRVMGGENILEQAIAETDQGGKSLLDKMLAGQESTESVESKLNRVGKAVLSAMIDSPGSNLASAKDTLWGAVNGVTYYADHQRGRTDDNRLTSAWFGDSDILKNTAMIVAAQMAGIEHNATV